MHHTKFPGKTALKVKGIVAHVESLLDLRNNFTFVVNKNGEDGYCVGDMIIPAKQFEESYLSPLLKNQEMQNVTIDPRHII